MLIDYCNNGDHWWPKLFHLWSDHLTSSSHNALLQSEGGNYQSIQEFLYQRERERKKVCQIFVLCSTLFIYVIYLSIYQDIKDLLNPAKTNLKIHENAQVGWRNPWKKKKINNNKLKWIKMKKVLLCTVSSTCTLMTVLHLGNK